MSFFRRQLSFRTKLIGAIMLPMLIVLIITYSLLQPTITDLFRDFRVRGGQIRATEVKGFLANYYANRGGWEGVEDVIKTRSFQQEVTSRSLLLTTLEGRVIASSDHSIEGQLLKSQALNQGTPIEVDGRVVGILLIGPVVDNFSPREASFLESVGRSILLTGLIGLTLALGVGLLLLRHIRRSIAPIHALTQAARQIQAGLPHQQVPAQTQDELGSLVRAFNEMAAHLQYSEERRRAMVADIAHELRTPVTAIQCNLELMLDGALEPRVENIAPIYDQLLLLARLVLDLQDLALADLGKLSLRREPVDLAKLAERIALTVRPQLEEAGITLALDAPEPLPPLEVDVYRIEQILLNLLSNARRYTPAGGRITLTVRAADTQVQLQISDSGHGIPAEELPHIFQRFYRGDRSRSRQTGGAGLGLAIAKNLVEAHGGQICVTSRPGRGTTFTVSLPLRSEPTQTPETTAAAPRRPSTLQPSPSLELSPPD
jgi:signal transduction histidine kinase